MEITINYYGQAVSVSVEVYEYLTQADHKAENLAHEQRRHWDGREFDEYIISTEGRLPYCATPEELICQRETLDEILAVLALCTPTQRERFLLYALHDFSYAEIAEMCGCTKVAVYYSIEAVRKKFLKFFRNLLNDCPPKWLPGEGCLLHHREGQAVSAVCPSCHLGGYMKIINLRLRYPHCQQDKLVEVSEEVFDMLCQSVREMRNYERRKRYHRAFYSLDAFDWTENYALEHSPSPEDLIIREIDETAEELLLAHLAEAIIQLSPTQARRLHARYALKKKFREIAADEGVSGSCATESVTSAVRKLRKIFAQNGWLEKEV